jgi:hypothetical protein
MIEFTTTEFVLLCWAVVATAYALRYKEHTRAADRFIHELLRNKQLRDELVSKYEDVTG